MSPLKIHLLLNLYTSLCPMADYPPEQQTAPAMRRAFRDFAQAGLLVPGVTLDAALAVRLPDERLTPKGQDLVDRLKAVEP